MTGFLVVMGLVAVVLGIIYRKQVLPVVNWLWNSLLFLGAFALFVLTLLSAVVLMVTAVFTFAGIVVLFAALACLVVFYLPVWAVALVIWAVTRKRAAFDAVNKPVSKVADFLTRKLDLLDNGLDKVCDLLDVAGDAFDKLCDFALPKGKVAAVPFVWLSRKLWPRG